MKAEHRKELHTNLLADRLGRLVHKARTGPKGTPVIIWVFVGLAVVAIGFWYYFVTAGKSERADQWARLDQATSAVMAAGDRQAFLDELDQIIEAGKGTVPGRAAQFQKARFLLQQGPKDQFADVPSREKAIKSLEEARKLYRELAAQCQDSPVLAQEAMMGAATAEEALIAVPQAENSENFRGTLDQAIADYDKLAGTYPDSAQGIAARKRAEDLRDHYQQWQEFYAQLNQRAGSK